MIVIDKLCKKYRQKNKPDKIVLNGICLNIEEGKRIAIVGENGCGKSTLMKTVAGILTPTSGHVYVDNIDVHKHRARIQRYCSFVFGNRPQLEWDVSLRDSLEFYASFCKYSKTKFESYLQWAKEAFLIGDLLDVRVRELSLGQRMRADIARALIADPKYLLMDEHTLGLDAQNTKLIEDALLRESETRNLSLVITTHDMNAIKKNTNTIFLLKNGTISERFDTRSLLVDCRYNMKLVFQKQKAGAVKLAGQISSDIHIDEDENGLCTIAYNADKITKNDLFRALPYDQVMIDSVHWQDFLLDDYLEYSRITGQ